VPPYAGSNGTASEVPHELDPEYTAMPDATGQLILLVEHPEVVVFPLASSQSSVPATPEFVPAI